MRKVIHTDLAPKVDGFPFSQAILDDGKYSLEVSGQIGINPSTGKLVKGISPQTEQTLANIEAVLKSIGWGFENITKVRIYLIDMADYQVMNDIYAQRFLSDPPARVAVAVKELPLGALVEIECVAVGNEISQKP